jgi:hypothetical protein
MRQLHLCASKELPIASSAPSWDLSLLQVKPGVLYTTSSKKVADHGGLNEDDKHVALLVSGGAAANKFSCQGKSVSESVLTRQVAPTVLQLLGIDSSSLDAVKSQGTKVLPGLLSAGGC